MPPRNDVLKMVVPTRNDGAIRWTQKLLKLYQAQSCEGECGHRFIVREFGGRGVGLRGWVFSDWGCEDASGFLYFLQPQGPPERETAAGTKVTKKKRAIKFYCFLRLTPLQEKKLLLRRQTVFLAKLRSTQKLLKLYQAQSF